MISDKRFDELVTKAISYTKDVVTEIYPKAPIESAVVLCKILDLLVANEVMNSKPKERKRK